MIAWFRRRRRFQIHLSTAVLLMFVAAGLLWVNLQDSDDISLNKAYGWPFAIIRDGIYIKYFGYIAMEEYPRTSMVIATTYADGVFAFIVLLCIWFGCERQIRQSSLKDEA